MKQMRSSEHEAETSEERKIDGRRQKSHGDNIRPNISHNKSTLARIRLVCELFACAARKIPIEGRV